MYKIVIFVFLAIFAATAVASEVVEIELKIQEHRFIPDVINVPAGRKIKLIVHNNDPTVEEFESYDLKREKIVVAGGSAVIILAPLLPGEYKFFGDFHQDTAQGSIHAQ